MISVEQIKAARGLLEWTQDDLADAAILSRPAINNLERRLTKPHQDTMARIQNAFEKEGIEFIDGGLRHRKQIFSVNVFEGENALIQLMEDIVGTLGKNGGEVLVSGVDERQFVRYGQGKLDGYMKEFQEKNIDDKLLLKEGDTYFIEPVEHYRWVSEEIFTQVPYMVYGDKYAIILWDPEIKITLIENQQIAESYRQQFYLHWNTAKIPQI